MLRSSTNLNGLRSLEEYRRSYESIDDSFQARSLQPRSDFSDASRLAQIDGAANDLFYASPSFRTATAALTAGFDRSLPFAFGGKSNPDGLIAYGERIDHNVKVAGQIAAPTTAGSLGAPLGVLGSVSFAPTGTVGGFIVDDNSFDVYGVDLAAGETWTFSVYGSGATPLEDTVIYLFDTNGNFVTLDDDGGAGRNSLLSYTAASSGTYFVAVSNFPGLGNLSGGYTLDVVQKPAIDVVPDTFAGAEAVGLGVTYGFIDGDGPNYLAPFLGEIDTYSLQVEAGKIYTIEIAGGADYASDPSALVDELDPVLVVWDSNGNLVGLNDDIGFPTDINSGFSFYAEQSGTYYFDVMSYDPWTGGFSITISDADPADFDPIESLIWDSAANVPFDANNVAYVYFAPAGENFGETADDGVTPMTTFGWNAWEIQQVMDALQEYEKILGVDYQITTDVNQATFRLLTTTSQQYGAYFYPQDPAFGTQQGIGVFNILSGGWSAGSQQSLTQGGFAYAVVLHEFGHAHGLSHPHDTGGGSEVMLGVTAAQGSFGIFDLNQGVYTVMSYNDAWQRHPDGPTPFTLANIDSGWSGTLGAFDIAALQQRYGVINPYATGNNVYTLRDVNDPGTYYETIWDTGGRDEIRYDGLLNAQIDLLAATLDYTATGGGAISFVDDVWGGYTIANGVVIENATGGSGADTVLGNSSANLLLGRNGMDALLGREGADSLYGGNENDMLDGGVGNDRLDGGNESDVLNGGADNDLLLGGNASDTLNGGVGDDTLTGGNGPDRFVFTDLGGVDQITDFKRGLDIIDLSGIDAVDGGGHDAFTYVGAAAFSGVAGELRAYKVGDIKYLAGDTDGDLVADFVIRTNVLVNASDLFLG